MTNSVPIARVVSFFCSQIALICFQLALVSVNLGVSIPRNVPGEPKLVHSMQAMLGTVAAVVWNSMYVCMYVCIVQCNVPLKQYIVGQFGDRGP